MNPKKDAYIMFFSYLISGLLIIAPYILFPLNIARFVSAGLALSILFLLGFSPKRSLKSAFRMLLVAGTAMIVSYLIANSLEISL